MSLKKRGQWKGKLFFLTALLYGIWIALTAVSAEAEVYFEKDVDGVWLIDTYEELQHAAKMPSNGRESYRLSKDIIQKDTVNGNKIVVDTWSEFRLD